MGVLSHLENLKECFSKVLDQLKMIVPIPVNTQISFKNSLAVTVQLIEQTIQSIELTVS